MGERQTEIQRWGGREGEREREREREIVVWSPWTQETISQSIRVWIPVLTVVI